MNTRIRVLASLLLALTAASTLAQQLPPTSRTVYKCEVKGKKVYSHEPCLGAQRIEIAPTRGLNKSTGRELEGKDAQQERQRDAAADAMRSTTGMGAQQLDTAARRSKLAPEAQRECGALDRLISNQEARELRATKRQRPSVQQTLHTQRLRARKLGC